MELERAIAWQQRGIAVVVCKERDKRPAVNWKEFQTELPTLQHLQVWFRPGNKANAAIICGHKGLVVLDFDTEAAFVSYVKWAMKEGGEALKVAMGSYRVRTRRGVHVYLYVDQLVRNGKMKVGGELWGDIKGQGGYVMAAGSVHPSGHVYSELGSADRIVRVRDLHTIIPEPPPSVIDQAEIVWQAVNNANAPSALMGQTLTERIRESFDILGLVHKPQKTGPGWYLAACPIPGHGDDKHPSLWVNADKGVCGCYKGCTGDKVTDVIGLYALVHNVSNRTAIKELGAKLA